MPIYEYQCKNCDHTFETIQKISDKPLRKCPACGKSALEKLISATAFRLKGDGWYETDFKSGNKRNVAGDKESGSSSAASDATTGGSSGGESASKSDKSSSTKSDSGKSSEKKGSARKKAGSGGKKTSSKSKS